MDDKPPDMPVEFYHQIDQFLNKPPPSLEGGNASNDKDRKKKKKQQQAADKPPLPAEDATLPNLPPAAGTERKPKKADKAVAGKVYAQPAPPAQRVIDPRLLKEAFEYTDQLLREAVVEEALEKQAQAVPSSKGKGPSNGIARKFAAAMESHAAHDEDAASMAYSHSAGAMFPRSAPAEMISTKRAGMGSKKGGGSGGMGAVKMIRSLKNKAPAGDGPRRALPPPAEDFVVARENEVDPKRHPVDFDNLVANFQSGASLDRLRKELADSQHSLAQSEEVVRKLTGLTTLGGARKKR